ncbi:hypothetical protein GXW76_25350, partial [Roseomonas soli]|nr:hypothetical protein [Neoroseomonas soli]
MIGFGRRPLLGLGLLAASGAAPARAGSIAEGALAPAGGGARLALAVQGEQRWSLRPQADPSRLVLRLPGANWRVSGS